MNITVEITLRAEYVISFIPRKLSSSTPCVKTVVNC